MLKKRTRLFAAVNAGAVIEMIIRIPLLDVRQQLHDPTVVIALGLVENRSLLIDCARRIDLVGAFVVMDRHQQLRQVVRALRAAGRLTRCLHGGQCQRDHDTDDGNDHQKLDECETM